MMKFRFYEYYSQEFLLEFELPLSSGYTLQQFASRFTTLFNGKFDCFYGKTSEKVLVLSRELTFYLRDITFNVINDSISELLFEPFIRENRACKAYHPMDTATEWVKRESFLIFSSKNLIKANQALDWKNAPQSGTEYKLYVAIHQFNTHEKPVIQKKIEKKNNQSLMIPAKYYCPITGKIMKDPVYFEDNHTQSYERIALFDWMQYVKTESHFTNPHGLFSGKKVVSNRALYEEICLFMGENLEMDSMRNSIY